MIELISPEYHQQLAIIHANKKWGASGYSHAPAILFYKRELKAKTILDFGCGRGTLKKVLLLNDLTLKPDDVREYDPGIPGKDAVPFPADLLVATDVLEHIEPDKLADNLNFIRSLTVKGAYFTIAMDESKVLLPDGRNAHLIIQTPQWWLKELKAAGFYVKRSVVRKKVWLWVWAR